MDNETRSFLEGCHTALIWMIALILLIAVIKDVSLSIRGVYLIGFLITLIIVIRRYLRK